MLHWTYIFLLLAATNSSQNEDANDKNVEEFVVEAKGNEPTRYNLPKQSVTRVHLEPHHGSGVNLSSLVARTPGIHVRSAGGFGAQAMLSVRGLSGSNIGIVLDNLPLSSVSFTATDLSLFPVETLSQIDIYRGNAPIRFQAPLGGLIHLKSGRASKEFEFTTHAGIGSNFNRTGHLSVRGHGGNWRYLTTVAYRGTQGDFPFYNDGETLYTALDDHADHRQNNQSDGISAHLKLEHSGAAHDARIILRGTMRTGGVPGPGVKPTQAAWATSDELSLRLEHDVFSWSAKGLTLHYGADALLSGREFHDPGVSPNFLPEFSMRSSQNATLSQVAVDGRLLWSTHAAHQLEVAPRATLQTYWQSGDENELAVGRAALNRQNVILGMGVEYIYRPWDWLTVGPAVRLDGEFKRTQDSFEPGQNAIPTTPVEISPRLVVNAMFEACSAYASFGRRHRFPTLLERYGDNVAIGANPNVMPEFGLFADAGGACEVAPTKGVQVRTELTVFGSLPEQLLVFVANSQQSVQATNISQSEMVGAELSTAVLHRYGTASAHYTWLHAEDTTDIVGRTGLRPPGIPEHQLDLQVEAGPTWFTMGWSLSLSSQRFLDQANYRPIPTTALQSLHVHLLWKAIGINLKARIDNLTNLRYQQVNVAGAALGVGLAKHADLIGYPKPGRTFFVSAGWSYP